VFSPSTYSTTIAEDHAVGTAIGITISATDPEGHNIRYSINPSAATDSALFRVDETSGMISLAQALNYDNPERHRNLSFIVSCTSMKAKKFLFLAGAIIERNIHRMEI